MPFKDEEAPSKSAASDGPEKQGLAATDNTEFAAPNGTGPSRLSRTHPKSRIGGVSSIAPPRFQAHKPTSGQKLGSLPKPPLRKSPTVPSSKNTPPKKKSSSAKKVNNDITPLPTGDGRPSPAPPTSSESTPDPFYPTTASNDRPTASNDLEHSPCITRLSESSSSSSSSSSLSKHNTPGQKRQRESQESQPPANKKQTRDRQENKGTVEQIIIDDKTPNTPKRNFTKIFIDITNIHPTLNYTAFVQSLQTNRFSKDIVSTQRSRDGRGYIVTFKNNESATHFKRQTFNNELDNAILRDTHKPTKHAELIIHKVNQSIESSEIKTSLEETYKITIHNVYRLTRKHPTDPERRIDSNAVKITIDEKHINALQPKLTLFQYNIHTTTRPPPTPQIIQCFKCYQFDHTAQHCISRHQTCKWCGGAHLHTVCTQKNKKCPNCNEEHSATYKKCQAYKQHFNQARIAARRTYADAIRNKHIQPTPTQSQQVSISQTKPHGPTEDFRTQTQDSSTTYFHIPQRTSPNQRTRNYRFFPPPPDQFWQMHEAPTQIHNTHPRPPTRNTAKQITKTNDQTTLQDDIKNLTNRLATPEMPIQQILPMIQNLLTTLVTLITQLMQTQTSQPIQQYQL